MGAVVEYLYTVWSCVVVIGVIKRWMANSEAEEDMERKEKEKVSRWVRYASKTWRGNGRCKKSKEKAKVSSRTIAGSETKQVNTREDGRMTKDERLSWRSVVMYVTQKDQVWEEENVSYKTENAHTTHGQTAQAASIAHEGGVNRLWDRYYLRQCQYDTHQKDQFKIDKLRSQFIVVMMVHPSNPSTWEAYHKLHTSMVYRASSRLARATQWEAVSETQTKRIILF